MRTRQALERHTDVARTILDALTSALVLGLTAPSDDQAKQAVELADSLASKLTPDQIAVCQARALAYLNDDVRQ